MKDAVLEQFVELVTSSYNSESLQKLTISGRKNSDVAYERLTGKLVEIKKTLNIQFTEKYKDKVITKNYNLADSCTLVRKELTENFNNITLIESNMIHQYNPSKDKIESTTSDQKRVVNKQNDKTKNRVITSDKAYLNLLGVTSAEGYIKAAKQKKYKQINRYIELIAPYFSTSAMGENYKVMDMGSGKGYLTFALYDYLKNTLGHSPSVIGVELRQELVDRCNEYSAAVNFKDLSFVKGYITDVHPASNEVLIALHACDTATDDAIAAGIKGHAQLIVCSPCCHKQIRKQMQPVGASAAITSHGILKERLAEMVTDTIRALVLEYFGYKTKIMEFIATEHTPKNLLIIAEKSDKPVDQDSIMMQIKSLREEFGIEFHYLEKATGLIS